MLNKTKTIFVGLGLGQIICQIFNQSVKSVSIANRAFQCLYFFLLRLNEILNGTK